jgi:hypothetical protein
LYEFWGVTDTKGIPVFPRPVRDDEDWAKLLDPTAAGAAEGTTYEGLGEKDWSVLPWPTEDEDPAKLLDPTAAGAAEGSLYK